jgi:taurine--2-oxoglutarate transaminase
MSAVMTSVDADNDSTLSLDRAHVFHSWSAQAALQPMVIAGGAGSTVWDYEGRRYLDFSSQLVNANMGHQHPRIVEGIRAQAAELATVAPAHASHVRGRAAELIAQRAPDGFEKVFFTNGGADANENAMRMARVATGRDKVISRYRSYHGSTGAAIVATGDWRRVPNEYARGHVHAFGPYLYRSEFWATTPQEECDRALRHLERIIQCEGPESIAAVLLETVPGTAGVLVPPPGYLPGVRTICDRYGIVLILDEVMAGFGRTGEWLALDAFGVRPDLVTFAKGVNSGYVPVGGVLISDAIAAAFDDRVFPGGLTYSGHPLAAASIVASLTAMEEDGVVDHAGTLGADVLGPALRSLQDRHEVVGEVRGAGVFWALELVADRASRAPVAAATMARLRAALLSRGLLPFIADNRLHVVPPCIISSDEALRGVEIIDDALADLGE